MVFNKSQNGTVAKYSGNRLLAIGQTAKSTYSCYQTSNLSNHSVLLVLINYTS